MVLSYPSTRRVSVTESFVSKSGGRVVVPDPYRWLEDSESDETRKWVQQQVDLFDGFMETHCSDMKNKLARVLRERWNYERFGCPFLRGSKYFLFHNSGLQNQSVLYYQDSLDEEKQVMLDPNQLSEDGTAALTAVEFSKQGDKFVYAVSRSGSDWRNLYIKDVLSKKDSEEVLEWVKFSGMSWTHDGLGFFYCRYPVPKKFEASKLSMVFVCLDFPSRK
jgi:prolyl oligopeptidase